MSLILLAGGNSSRLKRNKAFLFLFNKTNIEHIIDSLKGLFREIIIVSNSDEIHKRLGLKTIPDIIKNKGPIGGIYTGLVESSEKYNFVLACDMPFVNKSFVKYMLKFKSHDAVIPKINNYIEPLHSVYSKDILPILKEKIENDHLKLRDSINQIKKVKYLEKELKRFDLSCFYNINNLSDYINAKELARKYIEKNNINNKNNQ